MCGGVDGGNGMKTVSGSLFRAVVPATIMLSPPVGHFPMYYPTFRNSGIQEFRESGIQGIGDLFL